MNILNNNPTGIGNKILNNAFQEYNTFKSGNRFGGEQESGGTDEGKPNRTNSDKQANRRGAGLAVSIMGGGPLQAELIQAPRAGRQRAAEVLEQVYGGDQEYFKSVSPRQLAEQNAEAIIKSSLVRQVCGDQDETFANNLAFHEHLDRLTIPHSWTVLKRIDHNPMRTLEALGDSNWEFYRLAFDHAANTPAINNNSE
jgi:hypothetical protein